MKFLKIGLTVTLICSCFYIHAIDAGEGVRQMTRRIAYYPLSNDDQSGGVIILDTELRYLAKSDIYFPIVIDADNVYLDLNGYIVTHDNADENIITINASKKNIHVVNGIIKNSAGIGAGSGVLVSSGAAKICLDGLKVVDCGNGTKFDGADGSEVIDCQLVGLDLVSCSTGIHLNYVNDSSVEQCNAKKCTEIGFAFERCSGNNVENCKAKQCGQKGFSLNHCQTNCLQNCKAQETLGSSSVVAGFVSDSGRGNLIQNCVAEKTKTTAWEFCNKVYGILLTGTEEKTKVIDCIVREADMTSTVSALSFGISLENIKIEGGTFLNDIDSENYGDRVNSVAWSPDGRFLAAGGAWPSNNSSLQIFSFDGSVLKLIDSDNSHQSILSLSWSPNGKYLAVGGIGPTNVNEIQIFSFDGSDLSLVTSENYGTIVYSVAWSSNGKYLAVGGNGPFSGDPGGTDEIKLFSFDGSDLSFVESKNYGTNVYSVDWSPRGNYLAVGGELPSNNNEIQVYSGIPMYSPTDCLIKNNLVLDTVSYGEFVGTGISGTVGNDFVGNNYFLRNICCDNDVNFIYGVPNTFYGAYFTHNPFDNLAGYVS